MVAQFQAGEVPSLISLKAGGVGLNLTAADVGHSLRPVVERGGAGPSDRPRASYWPTTYRDRATSSSPRTSRRIMRDAGVKRDLVNSVLGGDGISSALFTREDVLALLGGDGR